MAAICVLATGGELNALTALVDDEGVDLGLKRRNGSRTLDVQVKARFSDQEGSAQLRRGRFTANVREETFRPREDLYMLYVVVNGPRAEIDLAWLVPSEELARHGQRVMMSAKPQLRFGASAKPGTRDKWRKYRLTREELPGALLTAVQRIETQGS